MAGKGKAVAGLGGGVVQMVFIGVLLAFFVLGWANVWAIVIVGLVVGLPLVGIPLAMRRRRREHFLREARELAIVVPLTATVVEPVIQLRRACEPFSKALREDVELIRLELHRQAREVGARDPDRPAMIDAALGAPVDPAERLEPVVQPSHGQSVAPAAIPEEVRDDCRSCGAPFPEVHFTPTLTCEFCKTLAANPRPFARGQEVMFRAGGDQYQLGCVVSCDGPRRIKVLAYDTERAFRFEDLVPVSADPSRFVPGTEVFRLDLSWELAFLVGEDAGGYRVKHPHENFQDSFFDRVVGRDAIRAPLVVTSVLAKKKSKAWRFWHALSLR